MVNLCAKLRAFVCHGGHFKVPSCAMLPIIRCHYVPCFPSQGAIKCQVPIASHCMPSPLQGAIACLHCPSQGAIVWHVAYHKEPSCAKFITLPIAWCHERSSHGYPVCQVAHLKELCTCVPHVKVPSCACVPHVKVPLCPLVAYCVCPLLCPLKGAIACQVSNSMVPLGAKFLIVGCHHVPCCPSQGAIVCLCWLPFNRAQSCTPCPDTAHHSGTRLPIICLCWLPIIRVPIVCKVSHLMVPSCAMVAHVNVP